jgi:L-alanine-DL-glutamate epimerase-like enolase superfamily enzyme
VPQSENQKIRSRLRSYERKLQKEKKEHGFYRNGAGKRYQIGAHYLLLGDDEGGTRRTRSLRMPASTRRKSRRAGRCIALAAAHQPALKVKLGADRPVQRIEAIRSVRPDATLVVDANQAWSLDQLEEVTPRLAELGVAMIEQPLPRGADEQLEGYEPPLPLCADESCVHGGELDQAARRYQMINIKLDKCGGLTHGLEIARAAREKDLGLMVGCMCGTSLAMAPAFVVGLLCDFHDLDGPLLLKNDRAFGMSFENGVVGPPPARLWG